MMETNSSIEIIPSLLTNSPSELSELVEKCEGVVKRVHVDIIDGVYADNKTIDPSVLENVETSLLLDFHLMVDDPINWVERCVRAGADRVIGHIEMMGSQREFIEKVTEAGAIPGLAIDMDTEPSEIDESILDSLDVILVMSVPAGFGGQSFNENALDKIHTLNKIRQEKNLSFSICDDGGVTLEFIDDVRREGADEAVVGRKLFEGDLRENVEKYLEKA